MTQNNTQLRVLIIDGEGLSRESVRFLLREILDNVHIETPEGNKNVSVFFECVETVPEATKILESSQRFNLITCGGHFANGRTYKDIIGVLLAQERNDPLIFISREYISKEDAGYPYLKASFVKGFGDKMFPGHQNEHTEWFLRFFKKVP